MRDGKSVLEDAMDKIGVIVNDKILSNYT